MITINAYIPPDRISFERAAQIKATMAALGSELEFEGLTGHLTVTTKNMHEVLRILKENAALLFDAECNGMTPFSEYFGRAPRDEAELIVYAEMCQDRRLI